MEIVFSNGEKHRKALAVALCPILDYQRVYQTNGPTHQNLSSRATDQFIMDPPSIQLTPKHQNTGRLRFLKVVSGFSLKESLMNFWEFHSEAPYFFKRIFVRKADGVHHKYLVT